METNDRHNAYSPGNCNIGPAEIRVRKIFLRFFFVSTLISSVAAMYWSETVWLWMLMGAFCFSTFVLYFEIRQRFCILFGFFNLHNFKQLGHLDHVTDAGHIRKDRSKVFEMILKSVALSLLYASAVHFLGSHMHTS